MGDSRDPFAGLRQSLSLDTPIVSARSSSRAGSPAPRPSPRSGSIEGSKFISTMGTERDEYRDTSSTSPKSVKGLGISWTHESSSSSRNGDLSDQSGLPRPVTTSCIPPSKRMRASRLAAFVLALSTYLLLMFWQPYGTYEEPSPADPVDRQPLRPSPKPPSLILPQNPLEPWNPSLDKYECQHQGTTSQSPYDVKYSLVVDAGSTGSRMHVVSATPCHLAAHSEHWLPLLREAHFTDKGASLSKAYINARTTMEPEQAAAEAAKVITGLIDFAKQYVPEFQRGSTTIEVKATAGLRQMKEDPQVILDAVERLLRDATTNPFKYIEADPQSESKEEGSVAIMTGDMEAIYAFGTLYLLTSDLESPSTDGSEYSGTSSTYPAVPSADLGGGSTQLTARVAPKETSSLDPSDTSKVTFLDNTFDLYHHSFASRGIKSALSRIGIHEAEGNRTEHSADDFVCINKTAAECRDLVAAKLWTDDDRVPTPHIKNTTLYAFSYFYDVLAPYLTPRFKPPNFSPAHPLDYPTAIYVTHLSEVTLIQAGACDAILSSQTFDQLQECARVTYIHSLLSKGYGMDESVHIALVKKLHGFESGWGLWAGLERIRKEMDREHQRR